MYLIIIAQIFLVFIVIVQSSDNVTGGTQLSNNTQDYTETAVYDFMQGKDQSLFKCALITFESNEYEVFPNGTVYIETSNKTLDESLYILNNGSLLVCPFYGDVTVVDKDHITNSEHLSVVGLIISMICLILHLITFTLVPDLRNLPGWNLAALCMSLLLSYALLVIIGIVDLLSYPDVCVAFASLIHFFLLSSILWMSIISFDVFISLLKATGKLRVSSTHFKPKKFTIYSLCAFGIALIFAILGLLMNFLDIVPVKYKPDFEKRCWFSQKKPLLILFGAPVIALICLNFIFFALSTYTIHNNKMKSDKDDRSCSLRRSSLMYFRLSVIMGVTWIVGVVATTFNVAWLWYLFSVLNTLQGLFIFLAFTCSKKVKTYLRKKFHFMGDRRPSEQTLSPTFQSYCYYANSIEKDLDKVVDKKSEKIDTIVIHL